MGVGFVLPAIGAAGELLLLPVSLFVGVCSDFWAGWVGVGVGAGIEIDGAGILDKTGVGDWFVITGVGVVIFDGTGVFDGEIFGEGDGSFESVGVGMFA